MPTPNSRTRATTVDKSDDLLGRIVDIVRRTGLAGFSLDNLAAELGTSSRMLVYYFGSKDELLARIVNALRDYHVAEMERSPSKSILDAIDKWWNYYRSNLADMQFFFHLTSRTFEEPEKFEAFSSAAVDQWESYFYRSLRKDVRTAAQARTISRLVLSTLRGLTVDLLITGDLPRTERSLSEFRSMLRKVYLDRSASRRT